MARRSGLLTQRGSAFLASGVVLLVAGLGPDVTQDERFTGAELARTDGETMHALLATLGLP